MWHRIFAAADAEPAPAAILERLNTLVAAAGHFHGDDAGWFRAEFVVAGSTLVLERFLAAEQGIRAELNSWAAHLEAGDDPERVRLMERVIQSRQLFTLERPDDAPPTLDKVCISLCRFLAEAIDGFYQIDDRGFFSADGALLLRDA
ncbi:MAG TPA: hypothetical protein VMS17_16805 [Gemmataceae bacterium]|nr:hypothetical protein [Gemmataceae bacterium]